MLFTIDCTQAHCLFLEWGGGRGHDGGEWFFLIGSGSPHPPIHWVKVELMLLVHISIDTTYGNACDKAHRTHKTIAASNRRGWFLAVLG
jgi:uncharacterized protein